MNKTQIKILKKMEEKKKEQILEVLHNKLSVIQNRHKSLSDEIHLFPRKEDKLKKIKSSMEEEIRSIKKKIHDTKNNIVNIYKE